MEQIYTIPVNEAMDYAIKTPDSGCPICSLYKKLEWDEVDIIMGASLMEPAIRIQTNQEGFCRHHYGKLLEKNNRLGLALLLESHLQSIDEKLKDTALAGVFGKKGEGPIREIRTLNGSCYLCRRIGTSLTHMMETFVHLWQGDASFQKKVEALDRLCLPHYGEILEIGKQKLSKKDFAQLYTVLKEKEEVHLAALEKDVNWFTKKFDYRYESDPWYNAKDSIERTIAHLTANEGRDPK